jgi:periplasmic protein TonB
MFEDSLIESGGKLKTKRGWTSLISFTLQVGIIGVMILIPLIFTEALPKGTALFMLVAPPPPPPPPPPAAAPVKIVKVIQTDIINGQLRTPTKIPKKVEMIKEDEAPPPVMASAGVVGGVPGGVPGGQMGGVIGGIISSTPVAVPKVAAPQRVRVSSGASGPHSGHGGLAGAHQQDRRHREPAVDQRAPDAGSGRDRSREAVEV